MEDLDHAIMKLEQAVKSDIAQPSIRLSAARYCSNILINQKRYSLAKSILHVAVGLLPKISPRELKRSDQ
jgi:hypothetical protein